MTTPSSTTDNGERHCGVGVAPGEGSVDIGGGLGLALRNRTPLVKGRISCRSGYQALDVAGGERFEANARACQNKIFCFHPPTMQSPLSDPNYMSTRLNRRKPCFSTSRFCPNSF